MKQFLVFIAAVCLVFSLAASAEEVCQNAVCKALSDDLLHHSINESVAPCESFFDYVCGKWPASHPQPAGSHRGLNYFGLRQNLVMREIDQAFLNALNSSNVAIRSVAQIYSDCIDNATIEKRGVTPLVASIQTILGDWPLLQKPPSHQNTTPHWQDLYVNIYSQAGISPVFGMRAYNNLTLKKSIINIEPGDTGNYPHKALLGQEEHRALYRAFYHKLIKNHFAVPENDRLKADIEAVVNLEAKINTAYQQTYKHSPGERIFHGHFADLAIALKGKADWRLMINQILVKLSLTDEVPFFTPNDEVHTLVLPYLLEAAAILEATPVSVVQNWLGLMITFKLGVWTTTDLSREIANFNNGHMVEMRAVCNLLPKQWPAVESRIYIDTHFSKKEKAEAELLVKSLRIAFDNDLKNHTEWLDEKTRKAALEKLEAIAQTVGYENWIISDETLVADYPQLNNRTIQKGKFFESYMALQADTRRRNLATLHHGNSTQPSSRAAILDITIVNAFYTPLRNAIVIPAGILQPPFFDDERPYSMNYGAIGVVIGHELTHAFDNNGARYDKEGKLKNWWTPETHVKFDEKSKCFADQYGALKEPLSGQLVNGNRTLGENIADNGGIKRAWEAYKEHQKMLGGKPSPVLPNLKLSADQLFFTAYAHVWCENVTPEQEKNLLFDAHSPGRFRVDTVLGNTPAFSEAFKCPLGSKMNPVHKCSVW